jgi:hypothetical protein
MTTINHSKAATGYTNAFVAEWMAMQNGDVGDAFATAPYTDKSVQVVGVFGAGGTVTIQGSNNGTDWATLSDEQGNALTFSTAGIKMPAQATQFIRPTVAGDGTTNVDVLIFFKE